MRYLTFALTALLVVPLAQAQRHKTDRGAQASPRCVIGKPAPDFTISLLNKPKQQITLSKLAKDKPVLLIFGSYT